MLSILPQMTVVSNLELRLLAMPYHRHGPIEAAGRQETKRILNLLRGVTMFNSNSSDGPMSGQPETLGQFILSNYTISVMGGVTAMASLLCIGEYSNAGTRTLLVWGGKEWSRCIPSLDNLEINFCGRGQRKQTWLAQGYLVHRQFLVGYKC